MRDASAPVHAACLAALTVGSVALPAASPLPTTPAGLAAALIAWTALWCGIVLPSLAGAGPGRVLAALLVAAPALAYALASAAGPLDVPWEALVAGAALGALGTSVEAGFRPRVAAVAAVLLVGLPLLHEADVFGPSDGHAPSVLPAVPARPLEIRDATASGRPGEAIDAVPIAWRVETPDDARRTGALARTPGDAGTGPAALPLAGARWMPVPAATPFAHPAAGPLLRVVAGTRPGAVGPETGTIGVAGPWRAVEAMDLDPYDALVLLDAPPDDEAAADVIATFARRGGLLVGVGEAGAWPPTLARALGPAAGPVGPTGLHVLGAGRVASVPAAQDVAPLLARGLHAPRAATAFDRATEPPRTPAAFRPPPGERAAVTGAALAAAWAAASGLLAWALHGRLRHAALLALAVAGVAAVTFVTRRPAEPHVTPFVVEVGGIGGRRITGIHVVAGAAGWVGVRAGDLESVAGLRALGFALLRFDDGLRLVLRPGGVGWLVEEGIAREAGDGLDPVGSPPAWAIPLLRPGGDGDGAPRLLVGDLPYEGPRPPGVTVPDRARALLVRP